MRFTFLSLALLAGELASMSLHGQPPPAKQPVTAVQQSDDQPAIAWGCLRRGVRRVFCRRC